MMPDSLYDNYTHCLYTSNSYSFSYMYRHGGGGGSGEEVFGLVKFSKETMFMYLSVFVKNMAN